MKNNIIMIGQGGILAQVVPDTTPNVVQVGKQEQPEKNDPKQVFIARFCAEHGRNPTGKELRRARRAGVRKHR